jgi:hypothetical protein
MESGRCNAVAEALREGRRGHVTQIFKCKAIFFCKNNFKLDLKNVEE